MQAPSSDVGHTGGGSFTTQNASPANPTAVATAQANLTAAQNQLAADQGKLAAAQQTIISAQTTLASSTRPKLTPTVITRLNKLLGI